MVLTSLKHHFGKAERKSAEKITEI